MYILGATEAGELVFVEFGITHRNGYPEFTASFNGVRPFTEEEAISPEEYFEMLVDDMGNDEKWDLCEQNDLRPSELAEWIMQNNGSKIQDYIDCSLYPKLSTWMVLIITSNQFGAVNMTREWKCFFT